MYRYLIDWFDFLCFDIFLMSFLNTLKYPFPVKNALQLIRLLRPTNTRTIYFLFIKLVILKKMSKNRRSNQSLRCPKDLRFHAGLVPSIHTYLKNSLTYSLTL